MDEAVDTRTLAVAQLAGMLGVTLAWRPWRRQRLTLQELQHVEAALAVQGWTLVRPTLLPRRLSARVVVAYVFEAPDQIGAGRVRRRLGAVIGKGAAFAGLVAAAITIWPVAFPVSHAPLPLSGEMNIAVLPFRAHGSDATAAQPAATALAQNVAASLEEAMRSSDPRTRLDVHALSKALDPGAKEHPSTLAVLSARTNADALIFGDVAAMRDGAVVTPYVYLAPRPLPRTAEASGLYRLGPPVRLSVPLGTSVAAIGELRRMIVARARGPAELVDAVGWYVLDDFAAAAAHLRAAALLPGWANARELAIVDLLRGNATAKLAGRLSTRLAVAQADYRAALAHAPGFARARFGLAEVAFQRAHGDCTRRSVNVPLMEEALAQYRAVPRSSWRPKQPSELYELLMKVHFGVGRVYLCLSQAELIAGWGIAQQELALVSRADRHDAALRDEAAEASADLAIAELPRPGERHARQHYLAALASYTRAIHRTLDATALTALYANRAFVEARLGRRAEAAADRRRAVQKEGAAQRAGVSGTPIF